MSSPPRTHTPLPLVNSEEELAVVQSLVGRYGPRGGMVFWEDGQEFVKIPLTQGKFALIDRADYEDVGRFRWHAYFAPGGRTHYCRRALHLENDRLLLIQMHQQLMNFPSEVIDHRNLNGLDNRRRNFRLTDNSHNSQNGTARRGRSLKGAYRTPWGTWSAQIRVNGYCCCLGNHKTEINAALAYDQAARIFFGEDARTNFPFDP
jgi:hypothetical protein